MTKCERGCTVARRHVREIDGNRVCDWRTCAGCEPRNAVSGLLCEPCHTALVGWLREAPGQHAMLLVAARVPTLSQSLGELGHRSDVDAPTPLNLAAADAAQQLADVLSGFVEMLADQYQMAGPNPLQTNATRLDSRARPRWSWYAGDVVWTPPPARFEVHSACKWLTAQLLRFEWSPGIGDLWEELREVMGQAHAIMPWREEIANIRGITCPCCHRYTLSRNSGEVDVTCSHCAERIPPARYQIWVRMLNADREAKEANQ